MPSSAPACAAARPGKARQQQAEKAKPPAEATITFRPADKTAKVLPTTPISVEVRDGWFQHVALANADGKVVAGFAAWVANTDEGKRAWSLIMLTLPGVKTLRQYALSGRFARLVGVLLGGGAPLLTALDDTIESIGDPIARDDNGFTPLDWLERAAPSVDRSAVRRLLHRLV